VPAPPGPGDEADPDERQRVRVTIALLGFAAGVQLAGMLGEGAIATIVPGDLMMHSIVVVPAAGFAIGLWRGLRMRVGIMVFALLWSAFSIWAVIVLTTFTEMLLATQPGLVAKPVSPWFLRIVVARSLCFTGAAIVLCTGRPLRGRRVAGAVLAALFAVFFVLEHGYQIFR
jgi:hypothetical protein